ncbi:MAG: phosphoglucosamine mutase, partial [Deltaproteobacteria bacterium]
IFARMLKKMGKLEYPVVVTTVMSNMGLRKALHEMGIRNITTKVGDRNVVREMKKRGAILGGEESGHIIFLNHHSTGDGIISALQLISALKILDMPLHELSKTMEVFPQIVLNVKVREKPDLSTIPEIKEKIEQIERLLSDKGRILVRYSGTEPVCRIMLEGEDKGIISRYAQEIASLIQDRLG